MLDASGLRSKALSLLARREHTRLELVQKLAGYAEDEQVLTDLLDNLQASGYQSDERFTQSYVRSYAAKLGRYRLEQALRERGVASALIEQALVDLVDSLGDELVRAKQLWQKKFGMVAADPAGRAKQARYLQSRGFAFEIIRRVIDGLDEEV